MTLWNGLELPESFYQDNDVYIICGDCLEMLPRIPSNSIDLVLCDLPYGVTARNKWDSIIDLASLWEEYRRLSKQKTAIVLTASQPFTSKLVLSNLDMFKYDWCWDKVNKFSGHLNNKIQPMRIKEDILVFGVGTPTYIPQMVDGVPYKAVSSGRKSTNFGEQKDKVCTVSSGKRYPRNILSIKGDERGTVGRLHPTQKPEALFSYLIETYTDSRDGVVLDNCLGSGTTAVVAKKLGRKCIGIEISEEYCAIAASRCLMVDIEQEME